MAFSLPRLRATYEIVTQQGWPTLPFQQWWQAVAEKIEFQEETQNALIVELQETQAELATAQAALAAAQADIVSNQAAIVGVQNDLAGYVQKDLTAAPAYTVYAGQTVSNPPTQGEMQDLDDEVAALSAAFDALKTALQAVDVLT